MIKIVLNKYSERINEKVEYQTVHVYFIYSGYQKAIKVFPKYIFLKNN